jgi:hypothetical protein
MAETLAALDVFTNANGLWRSDGDNLMFARQSDVAAIEEHLYNGPSGCGGACSTSRPSPCPARAGRGRRRGSSAAKGVSTFNVSDCSAGVSPGRE